MKSVSLLLLLFCVLLAPLSFLFADQTLLLRNVRQYVVPLQTGERIVVVDGEVVSAAGGEVPYVGVSVVLYDKQGGVIATARQLCGHSIASERIATMRYSDIISELGAEQQLHKARDLATQEMAIPFMVVFPETENSSEFTVSAYLLDLGAGGRETDGE